MTPNVKRVLIVNGPNLNMLGRRNHTEYGSATLNEIIEKTNKRFEGIVEIDWFHSSIEGEMINKIQNFNNYDLLIINPGGLTHTSVALRDAMELVTIYTIEVHLSNTYNRESFRQNRITSGVADVIIEGAKEHVYILAILAYLEGDI